MTPQQKIKIALITAMGAMDVNMIKSQGNYSGLQSAIVGSKPRAKISNEDFIKQKNKLIIESLSATAKAIARVSLPDHFTNFKTTGKYGRRPKNYTKKEYKKLIEFLK